VLAVLTLRKPRHAEEREPAGALEIA
jgi:hypothetical protein